MNLRTNNPPLQVDASSGSTIQDSSESNLRGGKQKSCICHGCLGQKVISTFPQWLWVLQHRVSSLDMRQNKTKQTNKLQCNLSLGSESSATEIPPWDQWADPPWVCRGCGRPGENWAAELKAAHTQGFAPGPSLVLQPSPAEDCPRTGCRTRWTRPLCRTGMHTSAWNKKELVMSCLSRTKLVRVRHKLFLQHWMKQKSCKKSYFQKRQPDPTLQLETINLIVKVKKIKEIL